MTAPTTTFRRLLSFWRDGVYLVEPVGSGYPQRGMTDAEMRELQKLNRQR